MSDTPEPKIVIDEDWKSQAQAEKEAMSQQFEEAKRKHQAEEQPLPPASFGFLVSTFSTQAMIHLGVVENPLTNQAEQNLGHARHFIDTLAMLEEKTQGNLTAQESKLLDSVLHDLRLAYVEMSSKGG